MRLLVKIEQKTGTGGKSLKDTISYSRKLLNHYERMAGTTMSRVFKIPEKDNSGSIKKNVVLFIGPAFWMKSSFTISLYTFLIRLGDKHLNFKTDAELREEYNRVISEFQKANKLDNDISYLSTCKDLIGKVILNAKSLLFDGGSKDPRLSNNDFSINSFHNQGGILSLCSGQTFDEELNVAINGIKGEAK
jgi:hypothetical protein